MLRRHSASEFCSRLNECAMLFILRNPAAFIKLYTIVKKIIALMLSCYLKPTATEDVSDYVMKCEKPYFNITSKTRALYLVLFAS